MDTQKAIITKSVHIELILIKMFLFFYSIDKNSTRVSYHITMSTGIFYRAKCIGNSPKAVRYRACFRYNDNNSTFPILAPLSTTSSNLTTNYEFRRIRTVILNFLCNNVEYTTPVASASAAITTTASASAPWMYALSTLTSIP